MLGIRALGCTGARWNARGLLRRAAFVVRSRAAGRREAGSGTLFFLVSRPFVPVDVCSSPRMTCMRSRCWASIILSPSMLRSNERCCKPRPAPALVSTELIATAGRTTIHTHTHARARSLSKQILLQLPLPHYFPPPLPLLAPLQPGQPPESPPAPAPTPTRERGSNTQSAPPRPHTCWSCRFRRHNERVPGDRRRTAVAATPGHRLL